MAVTDPIGVQIASPSVGIPFTKVVDTPSDYSSLSNDVYFFDKSLGLVLYKDLTGIVQNPYSRTSSAGSRLFIYNNFI
jgi:hypothetical protein